MTEFPTSSLGAYFLFQLKVVTEHTNTVLGDGVAGDVSVAMLLAGVPGAPATAPTRGASSGSTIVDVDIVAVTVTSGSAIESYQVDIDDGLGGAFVALQGDTVASLSLSA